jgi:hypothetical protein
MKRLMLLRTQLPTTQVHAAILMPHGSSKRGRKAKKQGSLQWKQGLTRDEGLDLLQDDILRQRLDEYDLLLCLGKDVLC